MGKIKITIDGMHCASCGQNIEKSIGSIKGVKDVKVSLMTHKGIIEAEEDIPEDAIRKAVERAGYKMVAIRS